MLQRSLRYMAAVCKWRLSDTYWSCAVRPLFGSDWRPQREEAMIGVILALILLTAPAHAEGWCNGMLTSNNVCIGSELNVPPVIVRCDYYNGSNSDPRCVGVGDQQRPVVERRTKKSTSPR